MDVSNTLIRYNQFTVLRDVLPLSTPLCIMIDPSNACNFRCTFCPTGYPDLLESVGRPVGLMKYDLFKKIIDDIQGFDQKVKLLELWKDGEPLLNKNLGKMIGYAKKKNGFEKVKVTSNGSLLTSERSKELIENQLDEICISIYQINSGNYGKVTQTFSNFETIVKNIQWLYEEKEKCGSSLKIQAKMIDAGYSEEEKQKFHDIFSPISDEVFLIPTHDWDSSKGFKSPQPIRRTGTDKVCTRPFRTMCVNFNGKVSVCCVDWSLGTVQGDVTKENLVDIWNGINLAKFRMKHLRGQRSSIDVCSNCTYFKQDVPESNIDDISDELIKRYEIYYKSKGITIS